MAVSKRTRNRARPRRQRSAARKSAMIFAPANYLILGLSVVAIVLGFGIMRLENEVDGFISLYVSPLILISGYIGVIVAILWRSNVTTTETSTPVAPQ